jgi:hypothetical protein
VRGRRAHQPDHRQHAAGRHGPRIRIVENGLQALHALSTAPTIWC